MSLGGYCQGLAAARGQAQHRAETLGGEAAAAAGHKGLGAAAQIACLPAQQGSAEDTDAAARYACPAEPARPALPFPGGQLCLHQPACTTLARPAEAALLACLAPPHLAPTPVPAPTCSTSLTDCSTTPRLAPSFSTSCAEWTLAIKHLDLTRTGWGDGSGRPAALATCSLVCAHSEPPALASVL